MIITCEACNTRYDVKEDLIKPQGTKMRCSACGKVFTAFPGPVSDESRSVESEFDQLEETTGFEETTESVTEDSEFETGQETETETEEIDLDELEKTTAFEESETAGAGSDEYTDDDFGDLDLEETETFEDDLEGLLGDFDEDAGSETPGEDETKEIGMTDLEKTLAADFGADEGAAGHEAALGEDLDEEDDEEFDLDLDITSEEEPGIDQDSAEAGALEEEFELDLDIEEPDAVDAQKDDEEFEIDLVESDDMPEATEAIEQMDTEEFGFDLEEDDSAFDSSEESKTAEEATDDFAVELDLGEADEPGAMEEETGADADQETLDFDLDDLDEFDEKTAEPEVAEGEDVDIDFDLDLDLDLEEADPYGKSTDEQEDTVSAEEDEFDLTDVEAFLDMEHETREPTADDEDIEEFDLGFDIDEERSSAETAAERDFDIDLEAVDEAMKPTGETMETIAMETSVDDQEAAAPEMAAAPAAEKTEPSPAKPAPDRPVEEPAAVAASEPAAAAAQKPEKSNALRAALIILLILAIAGGGYFYIMATREPPPEPDALAPPPVEAVDPDGNLQMAISTPTYMFVNNETAGELLVVTGSVTNRYDHTREQVRVRGNLYDGDGELIHSSAPVYTGMLFEADELEALALSEIESALTGPDAPGMDVAVDPDATESFMVVFSEIPDEVAEMNVEVVASESGG